MSNWAHDDFPDPFAAARAIADRLDHFAVALTAAQAENERLRAAMNDALSHHPNGAMRALRVVFDRFIARMAAASDDLGPASQPNRHVCVSLRHQDLADFVRLFRDLPL